jgi:hypothetical protein
MQPFAPTSASRTRWWKRWKPLAVLGKAPPLGNYPVSRFWNSGSCAWWHGHCRSARVKLESKHPVKELQHIVTSYYIWTLLQQRLTSDALKNSGSICAALKDWCGAWYGEAANSKTDGVQRCQEQTRAILGTLPNIVQGCPGLFGLICNAVTFDASVNSWGLARADVKQLRALYDRVAHTAKARWDW